MHRKITDIIKITIDTKIIYFVIIKSECSEMCKIECMWQWDNKNKNNKNKIYCGKIM